MSILPTPTSNTIKALAISYAYVFGLVIFVEICKKKFNLPLYVSRKIVHIGSGTFIFFILYLFEQWEYVVFAFCSFIVLNYISYRMRMFKSIDPQEGGTLGGMYFVISCAILLGYFHEGWENGFPRGREYIAMAGLASMTFGDGLASVIGQRYGKMYYRVMMDYPNRRTVEGSIANFVASTIAILISWWIMSPIPQPNGLKSAWDYITGALIGATISTLFESVSPKGTDNLSVPLGVSFILSYLNY